MNAQTINVQFQRGKHTVRASVATREGLALYVREMNYSDGQPVHYTFLDYIPAYNAAMALAQLQLIA